jgi:hypothetical protein
MIPTFILQTWLLGLFSLGIIGGALYLVHEWQQRSWRWDPVLEQSFFAPNFGLNEETTLLAIAVILMLLALAGGTIVKAILRLTRSKTANSSACVDPTGPSCRSNFTDPKMALRSSLLTAGAWTRVNGITSNEIFRTIFD